ncbi:transcriptional repressor ILP1-like [Aristolochia californica]|uniref:transcriptional repressor ILP1-like n=1 Tax=Aristolochia californica TaxID=171875 RepID=UPI0035D962F1
MSSRAKNFRRRVGDDEDDDGGNAGANNGAGASKTKEKDALAKPKKAQPPKASKLLSFAEDEDDDSPTTSTRRSKSDRDKQKSISRLDKTGSSAHKLTSSRDRVPSSVSAPSIPSNVQPQAGEYTIERLRELQKNTRTLASSKTTEPKTHVEPVVVLKGLIKPVGPQPPLFPPEEEEEDDSTKRVDPEFQKDKDEAEYRLSSMGIGKIQKDSSDSSIPDRATIDAIRAKRERLRQARAAPDYISLDARGGALRDDEGDFHGRIALLGEKPDDQGAKGVFESIDEGPVIEVSGKLNERLGMEGDEYEDEDEKWEEEQFRKGLGKRMDDAPKSNGVPAVGPVEPPNVSVYPSGVYPSASSSSVVAVGVTRSVEVMSIHQQAEVATRALQENFERIKGTHGRTVSSINATNMKLTESLKSIDDFERFLSDAKERYKFMYELRDYVHVLCQFLQDKAPYIEELEEEMQKLHEDRASAIVERRLAFDKDDLAEVETAVNSAKSVLSKGNSGAAAAMAAQAALASVRELSNLPCQLDEFGRDLNLKRRNDLVRKAEMRKHRQARLESKKRLAFTNGNDQSIEGELSSDESDSEINAYKSRWKELVHTAQQVFSNADDKFAKLSLVKERFSDWKKYDMRSYSDVYMPLSAPAIFSPYVRLELLMWDPLYEDADFYNMQWHSLLFDYGLPANQSDFSPDDADANLVPELVEKVALPILHHDIAHCWDILSTSRTKHAVSATNLVISYVPAASEALRDLLAAIRARLADAVSNAVVPTWDTLMIKSVPDAARVAAYRFGMSIRLLRNICQWKDILALPVLEQLALDDLLSGKILPHVQNITSNVHDAVTRTERIVASLSGVWSGTSVIGERSSKLQPLVEYVMILGKTLEKKHMMGGSGEDETYRLARRLKKMLVDLNEYDKARNILKTFHLKEAL